MKEGMRTRYRIIGKNVPRVDGWAKVSGEALYTGDIYLKGMLFGRILRSPYPHARIINVDTSKAKSLAGVRAIVTGEDLKGKRYGQAMKTKVPDKPFLAFEKVRFIGDEVAAVAADDLEIADEALSLIQVEYEPLEAVFDPFEAMKPGAPQIHAHAPNNIAWSCLYTWGEPLEKLMKECDVILEDSFVTHSQIHCYLEPNCSIAVWDKEGNLTVWASTQGPYTHKQELLKALDIAPQKIRVISPTIGGGFGGKRHIPEPSVCAALLSKKSGRPVKIEYTRVEEFTAARHRHPMNIRLKIGAKRDGRLIFFDVVNIVDNGAYNCSGPSVTFYAGYALTTTYRVRGVRYDAKLVYTNTNFGSAYRGYGNLQMRFALESMLDTLASELNIDPSDLRLKNSIREGEKTVYKTTIGSCGLRPAIEKVCESSEWDKKRKGSGLFNGLGIACHEYLCAVRWHYLHDSSSALVRLDDDGGVRLFTGALDIGQGSDTTLCQIVAEVLGVTMKDVKIFRGDSEISPRDIGTYASRITFVAGNAVKLAAQDAKDQLCRLLAEEIKVKPEEIEIKDNRVYVRSNPQLAYSFADAVRLVSNKKGVIIMGKGSYDPPSEVIDLEKGQGKFEGTHSYGAQIAEVEIDPDLGTVRLKKIHSAVDGGYIINPMSLHGQCHGSISHAQGMCLLERTYFHEGRILNCSFIDYHVPTSLDVPEIESFFVESSDPDGPFGAKGVCEGYQVPTAPAICNAIYNAAGIRVKEIPIRIEEILEHLKDKS